MTKNRRFEAHYDELNDRRIEQSTAQPGPCTLPVQAYGPQPLEWAKGRPPEVWAWITWPDRPASRIRAVADGWNDRVVVVGWEAQGGRRTVVVWRNAVTRRNAPSNPAP